VTASAHVVRVARLICAVADRLYHAWLDPRVLAEWWSQRGDGWRFAGAEVDARVGGRFRLGMSGPDGRTHVAVGEYRELDAPRRLVFTWDWEDPLASVGETLVTVELRPAPGATEVVVTHERFADRSRMGRHRQGWDDLLSLLEQAVAITPTTEGAR
jgi:uncharacterized protein YndB with AHSA1/START domain